MPDVDVVIPAHNEARTVGAVVRAVLRSPLVASVTVVDDGSRDDTAALAAEAGATVIHLKRRGGKGAALLAGVRATKAPILLFLDADLFRLTPSHVESILKPVLAGKASMNVGVRDYGWLNPLALRLPRVSGQRALRRDVIESIPPGLVRGYGAEIILNAACRYRRLPVGIVGLRGLAVRRKFDKVGLFRAVGQYACMWFEVAQAMHRAHAAHRSGKL